MINTFEAPPKAVLIVDDDAQTREGLALVLEAACCEVRTAANGIEALTVLRTWRPDLILLDLVMPVMDGWSFRLWQLDDPALAGIPVAVLSSSCDEGMPREAALMGISACFHKPRGVAVLDMVADLFGVLEGVGAA